MGDCDELNLEKKSRYSVGKKQNSNRQSYYYIAHVFVLEEECSFSVIHITYKGKSDLIDFRFFNLEFSRSSNTAKERAEGYPPRIRRLLKLSSIFTTHKKSNLIFKNGPQTN